MLKLFTFITKPPTPEQVRRRMIDHVACQLLHAEETTRRAAADRDAYRDLLTHLQSLDFKGLSAD